MKRKILSGLLWKYAEKCGVQGVQFIVQIILARLLSASDYGVVAIITVFIAIANVFIQSGFASALIQKVEADEGDFSSVFFISTTVSVACYLILFSVSPLIAGYYGEPELVSILRVQALALFAAPVSNIQYAVLARQMQFRKSFFRNMGAVFVSGTAGIVMALQGYGVWALVWSAVANSFAGAIILWFSVKWRPTLKFSMQKVKAMFGYGWKLLLSSLIDTVYNNLYSLIIGKFFAADVLGYYSRGKSIPSYIVDNVDGAIQGVLFPAVSSVQTNKEHVRNIVSRSIKTSTFLLFPAMAGLAAIAKPLTVILLSEKWLPSVPFIQIACISYAFWSVHTSNLQAISAVGRSDIFLKLEIIKKVLGIAVLCITLPYGVYALVCGSAVFGLFNTVLNAYPNKKLIDYGYAEQWKDFLPSLALSVLMGFAVWSITLLSFNVWLTLCLQIIAGVVIFTAGAKLMQIESFSYLKTVIRQLSRKSESEDAAV